MDSTATEPKKRGPGRPPKNPAGVAKPKPHATPAMKKVVVSPGKKTDILTLTITVSVQTP